ncbi:ATP-dependent helicase [Candidatus Pacearchaeota archaeon]|nr:ATP-dependent helicase [Candidatus Pacearchaeota archaeon]
MQTNLLKYDCAEPRRSTEITASLHPLVKKWFFSRFKDFSVTQQYGVLPIFERKNILISAPTGGTKTLTAFLSILNYLVGLSVKNELENKVYAVYCSPLKALSNDIFVNLITPLEEIQKIAEKEGIKLQKINVGLRTGDTEAKEKARMLKHTPHILVTTPESLAIMINSPKFSEKFQMLEFVIIDEIHSLAENKRGTHLSLTFERLQEKSSFPFTRIGLSATVSPLEKVANYLVGQGRDCLIAEVQMDKQLELEILSPVEDFLNTDTLELSTKLYQLIDKLIQENKTTLIFTNTRAATERVVHNLREKFPGKYIENIGAHHSSLSKEHRFEIEQRLREGKLKCVVCSTSLELGIDIGFIDLVILLGSPKAVSRAMQRIGRAGHQLHETARGRFVVSDFDDLVECAIIVKNSKERLIDEVHIPENCLDVLSQQVYGMAIDKVWQANDMFEMIKKSYPYRNLSKEDFFAVISYLSGEYELNVHNLYSKIWYDPTTGQIGKRGKMARVIYMTNIGTIPDESFISVIDKGGNDVGKIDELFLEKIKKGDVFSLGGRKYQFMYSKGMKAYVIPSDRNPTIPSWFSESLPLTFTTAKSIGKFRRLIDEKFRLKKSPEEIIGFIADYTYITKKTAKTIYLYFSKQYKFSLIPHDKKILIEEFKDNINKKKYIIFHSMFGRRVNDSLSRGIAYVVAAARKHDVEVGISDNGFFIAGKDLDSEKMEKGFLKVAEERDNLRKALDEALDKTEVLKRRFRHCAARSLMILRTYKGYRKSVGKQQMSSHFLLAAVLKKTKDFPILKEARREVLEDLMDTTNAEAILEGFRKKEIQIQRKNTKIMSPFAINLILQAHTDKLKIEDKNDFIKRVWEELDHD